MFRSIFTILSNIYDLAFFENGQGFSSVLDSCQGSDDASDIAFE